MLRNLRIKFFFVLLLCGYNLPAQANTVQDARVLYDAGKYTAALQQTDSLLQHNPNDVPALFLKAQILTERQRTNTAIETYRKLLAVAPAHLQAYNNLAALYAQQGQLELAAETLESAIRTDPVFTTIHTNLRTIYMDMSQKHYRQALKLKTEKKPTQIASIDINEGTDQILSQEIEVVPQSIQDAVNTTVAVPPSPVQRPAVQPAPTPAPVKVATAKPVTAPQPEAKQVKKVQAAPKPAPVAATTPKPVAKPKPAPKEDPAREVKKALLAWANAWSNRDAQRYVDAYLKTYATPGKTNKDWAAGRRWNFKNKRYIKVALSDIRIRADGNRYRASFTQQYESDNYRDVVSKELLFVRQSGHWKIAQEVTS